ncbi:MAG TPA: YihY/virulence factor BrkB family protein [Methylophilaceae bacterium]|nr:YihY/virulence factor BrkB family protein [Methylophilaceae bacterium]
MASAFLDKICSYVPSSIRASVGVAILTVTEWLDNRASSKAAALAFYTLFSMAPILVLAVALAGYFFGTEAAEGEMLTQLRGLVGENGAEAAQAMLAAARDKEAGLISTLIATALLIIGATTVFAELKVSLDELWEVQPKEEESGILSLIRTRLLSFGIVLVLGFLLMVSLVVSALLAVLENYLGNLWGLSTELFTAISWTFSFFVISFLFSVIYKMLPSIPLSWHDVWIGAIATAGLFMLGKYLIGLYLGNSGVTSSFGAAGSVIALMLWVYYSASVFFLGAEFTRIYAQRFGSLKNT